MATVVRMGTDPSGRPILVTRKMRRWWRRVCVRLGFTPTIVQGAWMAQAGGGGMPQFLSTHPSDQSRIQDLQVYTQRVMPLYQQARR